MSPKAPQSIRPSLSSFFSAARLRIDTWNRLRNAARRLYGGDVGATAQASALLSQLESLEAYWAYPGKRRMAELQRALANGHHGTFVDGVANVLRDLVGGTYRRKAAAARPGDEETAVEIDELTPPEVTDRPYSEVLVVDAAADKNEDQLRAELRKLRRPEDEFVYDVIVVSSFEDALIAALLNHDIQAVVIRYGFPFRSVNRIGLLERAMSNLDPELAAPGREAEMGLALGRSIRSLRPTLDLFLVTDAPVEDIAGGPSRDFRRVFYRQEDYLELHLSVLKGIRTRYETPFFSALRDYSQRPTGVFHALPISRGKSITKSRWIADMGHFYGPNVFLAETSATTGGLDSLLQPVGPIRDAQRAAARAFGAKRTFFVTNGTSTANKIVVQALAGPDDIVLLSHDCHKSHHYTMMLVGAEPLYLDAYPLTPYSMYGAVSLHDIKSQLLALRAEGKLDRVRMLLLTNCTFDGIVYNPERVMEEVLAIKPDMIFVWDEAWFAFARFTPISRRRTAMEAAGRLRKRFKTEEYKQRYAEHQAELEGADDATLIDRRLLPDPDKARIRVYATQSTHKTLTSLRQGSMIHVYDQDFERKVEGSFTEAYMTHTSTSPNYQILASLDVGRRQVELEGYELVQGAIELALGFRERVNKHPLLSKYFQVLTPSDLIPEQNRASGFSSYLDLETDWALMDQAWADDEFCLDPTRITLYVGNTGIDGDTFKKRLMREFDIQINKTSRNSVLFMTHIGSTRGSMAYLLDVLTRIAEELEEERDDEGAVEQRLREQAVSSLTENLPPLPNFSHFHDAFRRNPDSNTHEGDLRRAYFLSCDEGNCEYVTIDSEIDEMLATGRPLVSAAFVIPYPPGFPILVPGQVVSKEILAFLRAVDVKEIHGYVAEHGLRLFKEEVLTPA